MQNQNTLDRISDSEFSVLLSNMGYDAFGKVRWQSQTDTRNSNKFVGGAGIVEDDEVGLTYMRARYYDSETGRFISRDPAGRLGGMNLYCYVENNPVSRYDKTGMVNGWNLFKAIAGIAGNIVQVAGGVALCGVPTGVSQVAGGLLIMDAAVGFTLNLVNAVKALNDDADSLPNSTISAATALAFPNNEDAQKVGSALELGIGLVTPTVAIGKGLQRLQDIMDAYDSMLGVQEAWADELPVRDIMKTNTGGCSNK